MGGCNGLCGFLKDSTSYLKLLKSKSSWLSLVFHSMIAVDSGLSFLVWRLSDVILISMLLTGKYFGSICSGLGTDGFCLEWIRNACSRQGLPFQMQAVAASDALSVCKAGILTVLTLVIIVISTCGGNFSMFCQWLIHETLTLPASLAPQSAVGPQVPVFT